MASLREIGTWFQDTAAAAAYAVQHESPLDWPLWLVIVAALLAIWAGLTVFGFIVGVYVAVRDAAADLFGNHGPRFPDGAPTDPKMRSMWANREGPYSPNPEERRKWREAHGDPD